MPECVGKGPSAMLNFCLTQTSAFARSYAFFASFGLSPFRNVAVRTASARVSGSRSRACRKQEVTGAVPKSRFDSALHSLGNDSGASAVEFAFILPLLMLLFFMIVKCGYFFNNYVELANGVASGARQASVNRGSTTPYSTTIAAVDAGAPNLIASNITISITVNGTPCTSDTNAATKTTAANTCQTAFSTAEGTEAVVTATYPCNLNVLWITISGCTMSSSASQLVE